MTYVDFDDPPDPVGTSSSNLDRSTNNNSSDDHHHKLNLSTARAQKRHIELLRRHRSAVVTGKAISSPPQQQRKKQQQVPPSPDVLDVDHYRRRRAVVAAAAAASSPSAGSPLHEKERSKMMECASTGTNQSASSSKGHEIVNLVDQDDEILSKYTDKQPRSSNSSWTSVDKKTGARGRPNKSIIQIDHDTDLLDELLGDDDDDDDAEMELFNKLDRHLIDGRNQSNNTPPPYSGILPRLENTGGVVHDTFTKDFNKRTFILPPNFLDDATDDEKEVEPVEQGFCVEEDPEEGTECPESSRLVLDPIISSEESIDKQNEGQEVVLNDGDVFSEMIDHPPAERESLHRDMSTPEKRVVRKSTISKVDGIVRSPESSRSRWIESPKEGCATAAVPPDKNQSVPSSFSIACNALMETVPCLQPDFAMSILHDNASGANETEESPQEDNEIAEHPHMKEVVISYKTPDDDSQDASSVSGSDGDEEESEDEGKSEASKSQGTKSLLDHAHDRIAMQQLVNKIQLLESALVRKDHDLEQMSGQLRRAVATKCDLVLAHTELERHFEWQIKQRDRNLEELKQVNVGAVEKQAELEHKFMNDMLQLTNKLKEAELIHTRELQDCERRHRNALLEKDFEIAQLSEELRRVKEDHITITNSVQRGRQTIKVLSGKYGQVTI